MLKKPLIIAVWILLVVFPSATIIAETTGASAMLYAKGNVTVNGSRVGTATALFSGDTVQTAKDSEVTIALNGSKVSLPSESGLKFEKQVVDIGCGTTTVQTSSGLAARINNIKVVPKSLKAIYYVSNSEKSMSISAIEGNLSLRDGKTTLTLASGKMATMPGRCVVLAQDTSAPATTEGTTQQTRPNPNTATQPPPPPTVPTGAGPVFSSTIEQVVISSAVVGGTVATGLILTRDRGPSSSSRP